jgi:pimeloyl-ACP methyl ester carboxylesterase
VQAFYLGERHFEREHGRELTAPYRDLRQSPGHVKRIDVPTLILHGDHDQIVPIADSAMLSVKVVKGATLKVIPGTPHGMCSTRKDEISAKLLAFFKQIKEKAAWV